MLCKNSGSDTGKLGVCMYISFDAFEGLLCMWRISFLV